MADEHHHAEEHAHRRQGNDETVQARAHDQDAVDRAERGAEAERADHGERQRQAGAFGKPPEAHRRADADGADGEIEAACDDHDHHGEADHDVDRHRPAEREQVERRTESGRAERKHGAEDEDERQQPELVAEQPARRRRGTSGGVVAGALVNAGRFERCGRIHLEACADPVPGARAAMKRRAARAREARAASPSLGVTGRSDRSSRN
jgi:hypothetical protein